MMNTPVADTPLSLIRRVALGAGDFGFNLYWQTASLYLLFFYTDVLGVAPAIAGTLYMAALVWDAVLDPFIGAIADRTRSRLGRYRPYLILGGVPLALSYVAVFASPAADVRWGLAISCVLHLGFRTVYAVVSIPYSTLFARVTRDARIRSDLTALRMLFATGAAVLVAFSTLPLVHWLGTEASPKRGWLLLALIFASAATVLLLAAAWGAGDHDPQEVDHAPHLPLRTALASLRRNDALLTLLAAIMLNLASGTLFGKNLLYYFKYIVGDAALGGKALAYVALVAALSIPLFAWIGRRWGKRTAWLCGSLPALGGTLLWYFLDGSSVPLLFLALTICALGGGASAVSFWSMLPDTVEYGQWRSGVRTESLNFGLAMLCQKAALGIGAGLLGLGLSWIAYQANVAQSVATLAGLKQLMLWGPLLGSGISSLLIFRYPLSLQLHDRIVADLAAKETGAFKE